MAKPVTSDLDGVLVDTEQHPVSGCSLAEMLSFKTPKSGGGDGPLATEILAELSALFHLRVFIETGTFMGETVAAAIPVFDEIHTIELSPDLAQKATERFACVEKVHIHHGDSADLLLEILKQTSSAPLIWLDGHYSEGVTARGRGNTPVIDELKSIDRSGISNAVVLIDDLRLFDSRTPKAGDPESLSGYPSLQELNSLVASMNHKYQLYVYGDVALILPGGTDVTVSPLIVALSVSRLYDGSNLPVEEVLAVEKMIATTQGPEGEALLRLAHSKSVQTTEAYRLGLSYRFWNALTMLREDATAAEQEFATVIQLGFTHWRAKWYQAQACVAIGKRFEARELLTEVLASKPDFAPAIAMLAKHNSMIETGEGDLGRLKALGLWRDGQPLRLHLGCGEQHFDDYINIDYPSDQHNVMVVKADYQANITQLDFPEQSVDEIRLHHVFEHFNRVTALAMLIKWQQWLKVGGKLHIETPDLMGSAEILVSNNPWSVKMGTVRHLAGDQAASWAYHVDHWFPERYEHTLKLLGFGQVETQTNRWPHPPHLCNVHAVGIKTEARSIDQLLEIADGLLWESTVAPEEKATHAVWTRQLRAVLKNNTCEPGNIHVSDTGVEQAEPAPVVQQNTNTPRPAPPVPANGILPLEEIYDFNQRTRDRWVMEKAGTVPAGSRVLDMGAGTCLYRPLFAHCDYRTHDFKKYEGSEKHGGSKAYGKIDYVSDILAIPAPDHSFDVVLCTEVLEHVPEPIKVLREISRLLRPGGRAFITAPLGSGLHQLPYHFYGGYTPEWYRRFIQEAGMDAIEIMPNGGFFKHLAQECARAGSLYGQNTQLHGPDAAEFQKLLSEVLPRRLFDLDDKCFDERFTVGYFVEAVKGPVNGSAKDPEENQTKTSPVVVKLMGGLGNQMFQYAAGLALARKANAPLQLDLTFLRDKTPRLNFTQRNYALDVFPLHEGCTFITDAQAMPTTLKEVKEKRFSYDSSVLEQSAGTLLDGYWQSPLYFERVEAEVKKAFALDPVLTNADKRLMAQVETSDAVCLHVRRGDMVQNAATASVHGSCTVEYYQAASDVIARKFPNAHFYIFSDEPDWCESNDLTRGRSRTVVPHSGKRDNTAADMYLMRLCKHFIVANSTFSWWAAYLGDFREKTVIAPEPWFSSTELDSSDLLPKDWIRLSRNPGPIKADQAMAPLVSVIVPCYRQAHYLPEAIESIVSQTFADWEVIIVNDGSPDETSRVAREAIALHPERRIRLIEKTNGGLADARNAGIKEALGKYILPLDADDKLHPGMLQKTVALLDTNPSVAIAYTDLTHFGVVSKVVRAAEYDFSRLPLQNQMNYCSLFRREVWSRVGGYNTNMKLGYEDWDFWVGCGEKGFFGKHLPEPLLFYRVKDSSMYTKAVENHRELHAQIVLNHPGLYTEALRKEAAHVLATTSSKEERKVSGADVPVATSAKVPLVSVIVPTYNRPKLLGETLKSILAQTYREFEIIVVNDAGPDVSTIIKTLNADRRIRLINHETNKGLAAARNTGLTNVNGDYIAFLDDDDIFYQNHVATLITAIKNSTCKVVYSDANRALQQKVNGTYRTTQKDVLYSFDYSQSLLLAGNIAPVQSFLFHRSCLEGNVRFDETLTTHEDWDFWIQISMKSDFLHVKEITSEFRHRLDKTNMTTAMVPDFDRTRKLVAARYAHLMQIAKNRELEVQRNGALKQNDLGVAAYQQGKVESAQEHFEKAIRFDARCIAARKNLADLFSQEGKVEDAVTQLKAILDFSPTDIEAITGLGSVCVQMKNFADAEFFFTRVNEFQPENQEVKEILRLLQSQENEPAALLQPAAPVAAKKQSLLASIIIPVFNQFAFTKKCIESIYQNTRIELGVEIILVDNASSDETSAFLDRAKDAYPHLSYIRNEKNLGFAKACNRGAVTARGEFLVFLNNDTEPRENWLEELLDVFYREPNVGIAGSKLLFPDGTIQHAGIDFADRGFPSGNIPWPVHRYRGVSGDYAPANERRDVAALTGACLMLRSSLFHEVGGFDEGYLMYFEDVDLCLKVAATKKRLVYTPKSVVVHHEGKSSPDQKTIDTVCLESGERFYRRWKPMLDERAACERVVSSPLVWAAPFLNPSGYASEAINFVLPLEHKAAMKIIHHTNVLSQEFVRELPLCTHEALDRMQNTVVKEKGFILVSHNPAHAFVRLPEARYAIGRTMFETDRLSADWVTKCNEMDEVWVPTDFNIQTFAKAGVKRTKLRKIPGAIDVHQFDPEITAPLEIEGRKGFNFLAVFEWSERKGYDVLLKAYFSEFGSADDVCLFLRTYVMGRADADDTDKIQARINAVADEMGKCPDELPAIQIISKQVPLKMLPMLYKAADAFVAPSRGEGWGRPHMEAMAMELPCIATNWSGNTEFMNESNSYPLRIDGLRTIDRMEIPIYIGHKWAQPSVQHLRRLMRHLLEHRDEAKEKGVQARKDIVEKYSQERVAKLVLDRLTEIEEKLGLREPKKVTGIVWEGAPFAHHSLSVINRELCTELVNDGVALSLVPFGHDDFKPGKTSRYAPLLSRRNAQLEQVDIHVRHHWPPNLEAPESGRWVVIQPWEFGSLPKAWVDAFTSQVDEVWAYTNYVRQVYIDGGMPADRVAVVPPGFNPAQFHPGVKPYKLKSKKKFKFLFVGGTIYRKGIDILLDAYTHTFTGSDDVCLVIKDMGGDTFYKGQTHHDIILALQQKPEAPEIEYIDRILPENELTGLYTACDVLVHPYRGEGFGMPILEAMACGTPAIITNGGAALDFCNASNSILVNAQRIQFPAKTLGHDATVNYPWLWEADRVELAAAMKHAQQHPDALKALGTKASQDALAAWTWKHAAAKCRERIEVLKSKPIVRFAPKPEPAKAEFDMNFVYELFRGKRFSDAIAALDDANFETMGGDSATDPQKLKVDCTNLRAACYLGLNDLRNAKTCFEEALHLAPDSSEACAGLGEVFYLSEMDKEAKTMFEHAVAIDGENDAAKDGLAKVNTLLGYPEDDNSLFEYVDSTTNIRE